MFFKRMSVYFCLVLGVYAPTCLSGDVSREIQRLAQLQSLDIAVGEFEQKKYFKVLSQPIVSSGRIFFDQKVGLLWQTKQPVFSEMLIKEDQLRINDGVSTTTLDSASAISNVMLSAVTGQYAKLSESFTLTLGKDKNCVQLAPKDDKLSSVIAQVELCGNERLEQIRIIEVSGNYTDITLQLVSVTKLPEDVSAKFH